ncbi:MAG: hypothetical protein PHG82_02880 [Candidatus Gracilibacteria bacterium]|nr:hypothetical protein [Candidatus Gracilibacteria bacterium]
MIKIQENDTIVDIINRMNASEDKELILDFPFSHPVLHNYLSLKILKSKASLRPITIVTADMASRKIGKSLGINYSVVSDTTTLEDKRKENLLKHNFSFLEYMIFELKKYAKLIWKFIYTKMGLDVLIYKSPLDKARRSGVGFILIGLVVSFAMLLFIFYFAVSKTYVYITPEVEVRTKAKNITFQVTNDVQTENDNIVAIKNISGTYTLENNFAATGIDYDNTARAKGNVTFINTLSEKQTLKPHTRLQSSAGLMFETTDWVAIPARGQVSAEIVAKLYDSDGKFIGVRGNIDKDKFILPGLKFNRDKIYATSNEKFSGGSDNIAYLITKEDIDNAKATMEEKLKKYALKQLKDKIDSDNRKNTLNYDILGVNDIVKYTNINVVNVGDFKEGDKIKDFKMNGNITVDTFIYNKDEVLSILKDLIKNSLLDGTEKFMFVNDKSLRMSDVITRAQDDKSIKGTMEVEYGISYDFENNSNYYVKKIKNTIMGLSNKEATNILTNDTKISSVSIKNSPFFLSKVTNRPENIILKINTD